MPAGAGSARAPVRDGSVFGPLTPSRGSPGTYSGTWTAFSFPFLLSESPPISKTEVELLFPKEAPAPRPRKCDRTLGVREQSSRSPGPPAVSAVSHLSPPQTSVPPAHPFPTAQAHSPRLGEFQVSSHAGRGLAGKELESCCPDPGLAHQEPRNCKRRSQLGQCWEGRGALPPTPGGPRVLLGSAPASLPLDRPRSLEDSEVTWLQQPALPLGHLRPAATPEMALTWLRQT